ncbi:MAG TPA: HPP family protein [Thermomicrobiaceae bacterium]|nr:HPP family protein [Thermomicrobiaceae bacterium]
MANIERDATPPGQPPPASPGSQQPAAEAIRQNSLSTVITPTGRLRKRLSLKSELTLAALPTATVLAMFLIIDRFSTRHLLFTSLASSAFLIYLDPLHAMNNVRTLIMAHVGAALFGIGSWALLGHGYTAGIVAMFVTILYMIVLDVMHPPAASTALLFALGSGSQNQFLLFLLALGITVVLVILQRSAVWLFARLTDEEPPQQARGG